ncbi:PDxFFG protein [Mycoplasma sp. CSL10137]|uniref:PDxFFG protein n=1 Tax=Mycoplasma sp. CSL10137 TaxID=2813824 RepID=UPI00197B1FE1|nr:PDxFFG protein [Mycoplasma sp. CSL10137]MBN4083349.1 PDxFFG protein [Mycoplasma sp. CSL10137]
MKNKKRKKFNWRASVWPKYVISAALIFAATATTISLLKYNSVNQQAEKGVEKNELKNEFVEVSKAKVSFVTTDKATLIAEFDPLKGANGEVLVNGNWVDYDKFLNDYFEENHSLPFLNIRYGNFDFYNEYLEAVNAVDFYNFTQWFMKNVSWGPEIITLKEFSIVKGVEQHGNSITLGAHSNENKEYTQIKFYPDAFFGSIPLHSTLSGAGNASDSLLYKINKKLWSYEEVQKFLSNVTKYNSFSNTSLETLRRFSFRKISDVRSLKNKKVFVVSGSLPESIKENSFSSIEKSRINIPSDYLSIVYAKNIEEAKVKFSEYAKQYSNLDKFNTLNDLDKFTFEEKTIINIKYDFYNEGIEHGYSDKYLRIFFDDGKSIALFNAINDAEYRYIDDKGDEQYAVPETVESIEQGIDHNRINFSNLSSDIRALYDQFILKNESLDQQVFDNIDKYIESQQSLKEIDEEIVKNNDVVQKSKKEFKDILVAYEENKKTNQAKVDELSAQVEAKNSEILKLQEELKETEDEEDLKELHFKIYKLNKEIEDLELQISDYLDAVNRSQAKIDEYTQLIPTDEQLKQAHKNISDLVARKREINLEEQKRLLEETLVKAGLGSEKFETVINLKKLLDKLNEIEQNEIDYNNSTIQQKFDYVKLVHDFIIQNRPSFNLYSEVLNGNVFAELKPESDRYVLYSIDLGYIPTQLIAVDELNKLSDDTQINWREYYNIDGFLRTKADKEATGRSERSDFYVYAPKINSISDPYATTEKQNDFKQKAITEINKKLSDTLKVKDEFLNDEELKNQSTKIDNSLNSSNYSNLLEEFENTKKELDDLSKEYKQNIRNYVVVMTLKSLSEAEENGSRVFYKEIEKSLLENDDLAEYKDDFMSILDKSDSLRQEIQEKLVFFKAKVSEKLKDFVRIYTEAAEITASLKPEFDSYHKMVSEKFKVSLNNIINKIADADLLDPTANQYMNDLISESIDAIDSFNISLANSNKNLQTILNDFKDSLNYLRRLEQEFGLNNFDDLIKRYFSIISNPVFMSFGFRGENDTKEERIKWIAAIFKPIIEYRYNLYETNNKLVEDYTEKIEELENEIDKLNSSEEKKPEKIAELKEIKRKYEVLAEYYKGLVAKTEMDEDSSFGKIANGAYDILSEHWDNEDFEEGGEMEYDFEEENPAAWEQFKTQIDRFNTDVTEYTKLRDKTYDSAEAFTRKSSDYADQLKLSFNTFKEIESKYKTVMDQTFENAKKIINRDIASKVWLEAMNSSEGLTISKKNPLYVSNSKIDLIQKLTKAGIITPETNLVEFSENNIFNVKLNKVEKKGTKLYLTLKEYVNNEGNDFESYLNTRFVKFNVDANIDEKENGDALDQVKDLFNVIEYKSVVQPFAIKEEGSKNISTPEGVKNVSTYSVYVEAYDGFASSLVKKVPWATETLEGEHLVRKLNSKGEFEYVLENGKYFGLNPDSRVGIWSLIAMNNKNYKGLAADFLKFVAAHEYGHHMTLNSAQDLGDKGNKPIFGSALTPGSTPNIQNYYKRDVIDLYLKARTHLSLNSSPLLNQPNIVSEENDGEYLLFNLPKKENNEIINNERTVEKPENVWGNKVGNENLKDALLNNNRRFLQTYEGLLKATESRRKQNGLTLTEDKKWLNVSDLWLMNTLDQNSGTLNPSKNSDEQYPVKYMVQDADGVWRFKKASLDMLKGKAKDGMGNLIDFYEYNGEILPKIVEGERNDKGEFIKIDKVLIFNKDKTPIINVPLGIDFTSAENNPFYQIGKQGTNTNVNITLQYVNKQIKDAEDTIKSLIVDNYSINGWDSNTSNTSLEPKTSVEFPLLGTLFSELSPNYNKTLLLPYLDNVKSRKRSDGGINASYFIAKYYGEDGEVLYDRFAKINKNNIIKNPLVQEEFYLNPYSEKSKADSSFVDVILELYLGTGGTYETLSAGGKHVLWLSENEQYLPNVNLKQIFTTGFLDGQLSADILKQLEQKQFMDWMSPFVAKFIGRDVANNSFLMINGSGDVVSKNTINPTLPNFAEFRTLKINQGIVAKDIENNLFNSYYVTGTNGIKNYGFDIQFNDFDTFLAFTSVDTTKAILDVANNVVNWDLDYVKARFDIPKFARELKIALAKEEKLTSEEKSYYNKLIESNNEQQYANEIMKRFTNSSLNLFTRDHTFKQIRDKINESKENELRYGWIFDKDLGYGLFKSDGVVVSDKARENDQWSISVKKFFDTYQSFADENQVDLDQFSLFDDLILDDKIQMYTTQLLYNLRLSKFQFKDILLSFARGKTKKIKPTSDVEAYFKTKTERKFNELFSDYTYSFAETINRDNLQITYSPSQDEYRNLPSFLSGLNESNTGLEYVLDGSYTAKWRDLMFKFKGEEKETVQNTIVEFEQKNDNEDKYRSEKIGTSYSPSDLASNDNFSDDQNKSPLYLGRFQSINNGWFKDRWYRDFINFRLYDDEGNSIQDDTIRITDLEGNVVSDRAKAYWEYYIQSQGVGKRNVSNIWRNTDKDAIAMFGYLNNEDINKVDYLVFEDLETQEVKTIKINKKNSSNMFYYKTQNVNNENNPTSRHWLGDERYNYTDSNGHHQGQGFTAWVSDYAIMSNYSNKLLTPNHEYKIYFSDNSKGTKTLEIDLGTAESISENGKTFSQAPTSIYLKEIDGKKVPVFKVGVQFNGTK